MSAAPSIAGVPSLAVLPVVSEAGLTLRPLMLVYAYVVGTFVLFLLWPVNWPIYHASEWARLIGYVALCLAALAFSLRFGAKGSVAVTAPLPGLPALLAAAAVVASLLIVPSSLAYTGDGPWKVLDALQDQGAAYRRLQAQLETTTGQRTTIVALRTLAAPLIYAALPLAVIHWRRIGWIGWLSVGIVVANSIVFSIMRGTDKEIADLLIVAAAALFVVYGRAQMVAPDLAAPPLARFWKPALLAVVFFYLAQGLFTQRKDERLGGYENRTQVCANDSRICANLDSPGISWLPQRQRFAATVFILSTCSGYYGLNLALEKPFETTWGLGHSPAILTVYEVATGDPALHRRTYTYRNGEDGWSEQYYWSTLITWLANDVGFGGAVLLLAGIGFLWGRWWRDACAGKSDAAAVLFCAATTAIFYLPANNQLLASYDGYSVLAVWIAVWLWRGRRRRVFVELAPGPARQ